jgi:hypothetical protein
VSPISANEVAARTLERAYDRALELFDAGEARTAAATFLHRTCGLERGLTEAVDALLVRAGGNRETFEAELRLLRSTPTSIKEPA